MNTGASRPGAHRDAAVRAGMTDGTYLIRVAMRRSLGAAVADVAARARASREILVLDIGGRGRPYADLIASGLSVAGCRVRHVVIDAGGRPDAVARAEALPVLPGCADIVLCTQVLEHVEDPARAVSEMARTLKPDGVCLLTTHGTWFYHPDPEDYWRWTSAGLARLFSGNGFAQVAVEPVGGTRLALAALILTAFERSLGSGPAGGIARRVLVAPANWLASRRLAGRAAARRTQPGELAINYLVTARRAP